LWFGYGLKSIQIISCDFIGGKFLSTTLGIHVFITKCQLVVPKCVIDVIIKCNGRKF